MSSEAAAMLLVWAYCLFCGYQIGYALGKWP